MNNKKQKRVCSACVHYKKEIADRGYCFKQFVATCDNWTCCYYTKNKRLF